MTALKLPKLKHYLITCAGILVWLGMGLRDASNAQSYESHLGENPLEVEGHYPGGHKASISVWPALGSRAEVPDTVPPPPPPSVLY
jgi:hypothetical protein